MIKGMVPKHGHPLYFIRLEVQDASAHFYPIGVEWVVQPDKMGYMRWLEDSLTKMLTCFPYLG